MAGETAMMMTFNQVLVETDQAIITSKNTRSSSHKIGKTIRNQEEMVASRLQDNKICSEEALDHL